MRIEALPVLLLGFVSGVALGSFFDFGLAFPVFFAVLSVAIFLSRGFLPEQKMISLVSFFLIALALGLARMNIEQYRYENNLVSAVGEKIAVRGIISEYPDVRETNARYVVEPEEISAAAGQLPATERILVISDLYPALRYGDEVLLTGKLQAVKNFSDNGANFDYKKYLSKDGVFHEMFYPGISVVSGGEGNLLIAKLFLIREKFSEMLRGNINEPDAALALGMLIGEKHTLPKTILDDFKRAGVIHLVVLSGYNIALVSQFFIRIFSFLPILYRTSAGGVAIILFVLMTGGGASAIRAAVMALIALLGIATGRTYDAGRALFVAGFLMILENPNVLIFDPSFELSFLATLGLIYLTPLVHARLGRWKPAWLRELLSQTLATQIAVLPLLVYMSGSVSLLSIPANLLILPTVPFAMMGSFVTGILGFVGHTIALPFSLVTSALLSYAILTAKFFASLPFSALAVPAGAGSIIALILMLGIILFLLRKKMPADIVAQ